MTQFVDVPSSAYNKKNLKTQAVKNLELPDYQVEQNFTYQNNSLKKK